ncbi:MAG: CpXC domain-containing protein [Lachnospiraceae bacterium]|nr:CpXC domain-containing protein [Lachnospiraceae bacterium]
MEKVVVKTVSCPKCQGQGQFNVYSSINSVQDPEETAKLKNLSIFDYVCPHCNARVTFDYGLLYHDMNKRIMIYYKRKEAEAKKAADMFLGRGIYDVAEDLKGKYLYRVVRRKRQLREKIAIFDANLDDRYMELSKLYYQTKFEADYPDLEAETSYIYGSEGLFYVAFSTKEGEISTNFDMAVYNHMKEVFPELSDPLRGGDVFIDQEWALKQLKNRTTGDLLTGAIGGDLKITIT